MKKKFKKLKEQKYQMKKERMINAKDGKQEEQCI